MNEGESVDVTVGSDEDCITPDDWKERAEKLRRQLNEAVARHARISEERATELAVEREKVKTAQAEMRSSAERMYELRGQLARQNSILRAIHQLTEEP